MHTRQPNLGFLPFLRGRHSLIVAPDWAPLLQAHGLDSALKLYSYQRPAGDKLKACEVRQVELEDTGRTRTLFIKTYSYYTLRKRWRRFFRGTFLGRPRALREFITLSTLRQLGFDAATPVAYAEDRSGGFVVRAVLVSEGVPQATALDAFIREHLFSRPAGEQRSLRQRLIGRLAHHTRQMHDAGFIHGNYYWRNILLSGGSLDRFFLIDSHRGGLWRWSRASGRDWDLATLDSAAPCFFSRADRLRFYLAYAGLGRLGPADKRTIRRVLRRADPLRPRQSARARKTGEPWLD